MESSKDDLPFVHSFVRSFVRTFMIPSTSSSHTVLFLGFLGISLHLLPHGEQIEKVYDETGLHQCLKESGMGERVALDLDVEIGRQDCTETTTTTHTHHHKEAGESGNTVHISCVCYAFLIVWYVRRSKTGFLTAVRNKVTAIPERLPPRSETHHKGVAALWLWLWLS